MLENFVFPIKNFALIRIEVFRNTTKSLKKSTILTMSRIFILHDNNNKKLLTNS